MDQTQVQDQKEDGQGQGLKGLVAPEGDQSAQGAGRHRRRRQHYRCLKNLIRGHSAQKHIEKENRHHACQEQKDLQQDAQELAQEDFIIPQIGEQQKDKGAAIFFLSDGAGRPKSRKEQQQGQLNVG